MQASVHMAAEAYICMQEHAVRPELGDTAAYLNTAVRRSLADLPPHVHRRPEAGHGHHQHAAGRLRQCGPLVASNEAV